MEAKVAALDVRVETLEKWTEKHEDEDARQHKYQNAVIENMFNKLAEIQLAAARFEADLQHRTGSDLDTRARLQRISDRLAVIERMAWIALGGMLTVGALATFFGWNILKLLTR